MRPGAARRVDVEVGELLRKAKTIALVGASPDPYRPSHTVMRYLLSHGYEVIPVRPGGETILGKKCVDSLDLVEGPVDIVDVFRAGSAAPDLARQAVAAGASCLWLQEGVRSEEAARIAQEGGLQFVQDKCIKKVHAALS